MDIQKGLTYLIAAFLLVLILWPGAIGTIAGNVHSSYAETMRERAAQSYRDRNPINQ